MWIGLAIGWVLGSISLYVYMYLTAREAPLDECVECRLPECTECPYQTRTTIATQKRAA